MPRNVQTRLRAEMVAQQVALSPLFVAFQWDALVEILTELIPVVISCFRPDDGPQAAAYVARRWSPERGYDSRLVKGAARRAKYAAARKRIRMTWDQAYEVALRALDDIRTGDMQQASLVIREQEERDFAVAGDHENFAD